jgi:hypothetical protein
MIVRLFRTVKRLCIRAKRNWGSGETEHQQNERIMARWTRKVGVFTLLLVLSGTVSDFIIFCQLKVIQDQLSLSTRPKFTSDQSRFGSTARGDPKGSRIESRKSLLPG